jgi:outer membrane protein TolC
MFSRRVPVVLLLVAGTSWQLSPEAPLPLAEEPKDTRLKELLKERVETLRKVVEIVSQQYKLGGVGIGQVVQAQQSLLRAELDLCDSDKERIAVLEKLVSLMKDHEKIAAARFKSGDGRQGEALMAKATRLDAEIALERLRVKAKDPSK